MIITEQELVNKFHELNKGRSLHNEIPVFARSVDMVEVKDDEIICYEFKLVDWKKVIKQVESVRISFDYSYVVMVKPKRPSTVNRIYNECQYSGIGLIFYSDNNFEEYLQPKRNNTWSKIKDELLEKVKNNHFGL